MLLLTNADRRYDDDAAGLSRRTRGERTGTPLPGAMPSFREMMAEVDRLEEIRWQRFVDQAKAEAKPARAMSPTTAARAAAKLRERAVLNKRLATPSVDLNALD